MFDVSVGIRTQVFCHLGSWLLHLQRPTNMAKKFAQLYKISTKFIKHSIQSLVRNLSTRCSHLTTKKNLTNEYKLVTKYTKFQQINDYYSFITSFCIPALCPRRWTKRHLPLRLPDLDIPGRPTE